MTVAYWCVLFAGLLPYVWAVLAKAGAQFDNHAPRESFARVEGWRKRASWAQLNAFEALPLFIAAVIIAHLAHVAQARIDILAVAFVVFRIAHGLVYIADWATVRSLVWAAGFFCILALFISAA